MTTYPIPADEKERLNDLFSYGILDTPVETEFEDIVHIVTRTFNVPAAAITFVDSGRQWVKAKQGLDFYEIDRNISICAHTILQDEVFEVDDLWQDECFSRFPYVSGEPHFRYYAGASLVTKKGYHIGSLCIVDHHVRRLNEEEHRVMTAFARNIITQLEIRLQNKDLQQRNEVQQRISAALSHDIRGPLANVKILLDMQSEEGEKSREDESREINQMLKRGVEKTMGILDNMIQWGKLQFGGDSTASRFSLRELADDALNEVYDSNSAKFNMLVNAVPDSIVVTAEREGVRFVLRNLLTNAGKFTHNGCITVSCEQSGGRTMLLVRDTGTGMSPETTARLNRCQTITHTIGTNNEKGHGLGLNLVQEYIAGQGKDLFFQSMMGVGTIVSFEV